MTTRSKGFTLIELLVVVAIIGILGAVGIISYSGYVSSTKKKSAENAMMQLSLAQTEYYSENSVYYGGTLAVGIFSNLEILGTGLSRMDQIKAQLIGIGAIGIFSFVSSFIFFKIVNYFYPLRVSPLHEELGLNIAEHGAVSVEHD